MPKNEKGTIRFIPKKYYEMYISDDPLEDYKGDHMILDNEESGDAIGDYLVSGDYTYSHITTVSIVKKDFDRDNEFFLWTNQEIIEKIGELERTKGIFVERVNNHIRMLQDVLAGPIGAIIREAETLLESGKYCEVGDYLLSVTRLATGTISGFTARHNVKDMMITSKNLTDLVETILKLDD